MTIWRAGQTKTEATSDRSPAPVTDDRLDGRQEKGKGRGQAIVEFSIVSVLLLLLSIGTVDLGRAIYLNAQLEAGVRDAAREGKRMAVSSSNGYGYDPDLIKKRVTHDKNLETNKETERHGLSNTSVAVTCASGCSYGSTLTVSASLPFKAIAQDFLGIKPFTLKASATVVVD